MGLSDEQFEFLVIQESVLSSGLDLLLTGIYICMIFFILYFFCSSRRCRARKSSKILTGVILLMFVIRMMHVGIFWYQNWFEFVKHGESRDSVISASETAPDLIVSDITSILLTAIADSVMVWRCWIITNASVKVNLLPFLLNLLAIVFGLIFVSLDRLGADTPPIAILMSTLNMAFSVATTILSTLIIAIRILIARKVPGDLGGKNRYSKPLAIIIESSSLYTIAFIIYIPFFTITTDFTNTTYMYAASVAQNMTVIAPALIMLRVFMSKDQPDGEQSKSQSRFKVTTLRFQHDSGTGSQSEHRNASSTPGSQENIDREEEGGILQSDNRSEQAIV